jgi:ABC-2 type transport system ATP-binding protein
LSAGIERRFGEKPRRVDGTLRIEREDGHSFIKQLVELFPAVIDTVSVGKPTLEDVFVRETGHRFWTET